MGPLRVGFCFLFCACCTWIHPGFGCLVHRAAGLEDVKELGLLVLMYAGNAAAAPLCSNEQILAYFASASVGQEVRALGEHDLSWDRG